MLEQRVINTDALAEVPLFSGLARSDLAMISQAAIVRQIKNSTVLFREATTATALYVVAEGRFKISHLSADGHELLLRFVGCGQMLGGTAMLEDGAYPMTATAVESSRVLSWDNSSMGRFIMRYPRLARNALRLMAQRITELQDRCRELSTEQVDQRIARALLRLAQQTGRKVDGGILLGVKLSRQDLAEMTGTTLFTASRILSRWSQAGLIKAGRQRVFLCRAHELVCIAEDLPKPQVSPVVAP